LIIPQIYKELKMTKKLIIGLAGLVLLAGVAVYAAEKAKEKAEAAKPEQPKACEMQKHPEGLIDQLIKAYKADDKKAMGEIIAKLEKRREQMRKFAKFERWHQMAHRRMMLHRFWGNRGGCWGCPGMFNRNWGPPAGGFRPMPQWRHPGGFDPLPQWKGCPQGGERAFPEHVEGVEPQEPNQPLAPPAEKPGAMWNNDDPTQESEGLSALDDQALFEGPDNEVALNDDTPADSEW
jgi:hypothetical protein